MNKAVVIDTGPLIALAIADLLSLLPKLFHTIYVTDAVINEALLDMSQPGAKKIHQAIINQILIPCTVEKKDLFLNLMSYMGSGEVETLSFARSLNIIALIDEKRARKFALNKGIGITGSAAVLIAMQNRGLIQSVKPALSQLKSHGYRLSDALIEEILKLAK